MKIQPQALLLSLAVFSGIGFFIYFLRDNAGVRTIPAAGESIISLKSDDEEVLAPDILHIDPATAPAEVEVVDISRTTFKPPESTPVEAMLFALETNDSQRFKALFLPSARKRLERKGWESTMKHLGDLLRRRLGSVSPTDFYFVYSGGSEKGVVFMTTEGCEKPGKMNVIKIDSVWYLDLWR